MATTATETVGAIIADAAFYAGMLDTEEALTTAENGRAIRLLNMMLKSWQVKGYPLWVKTAGSLDLGTVAAYDLDPLRPLRILSARFERDGIETPMIGVSRDEYDALPDKTVTGQPTQFYYDRQREAAKFYVWPLLAAADGETVKYTYERELEDVTDTSETLDMPGEWWEAVATQLALRLCSTFSLSVPAALPELARTALEGARAGDCEATIEFGRDD